MYKNLLFIPVYNCENQITRVLDKIDNNSLNYISEILIVNNRSNDKTESAIINYCNCHMYLPVKLIQNDDNYNLGGSHKVAFQYAIENHFDYCIVLHGDDQGNIHDLLPYLESGEAYKYDSFLGSRFDSKSVLINYSKFRIWGNYIFNNIVSIALGKKITDLGSGLNMYKVDYLKSKFYMGFINSLTFNVYMLMYGVYSKSSFSFFPLSWREEDQISNAKFFKQSKEILKLVLKYIFTKNGLFNETQQNDLSKIIYSYKIIYGSKKSM